MRTFVLLAFASTVFAAAAPVTTDSPLDTSYVAKFSHNANYNITGTVNFSSNMDGTLEVQVNLRELPNLPVNEFPYHVHVNAIPANGDCSAAMGHLNPYSGNSSATNPAEKLVGDLAGKHGNAVGPDFQTSYIESYLSLSASDPAFIGNNRSVVIHDIHGVMLACANIKKVDSISALFSALYPSMSSTMAMNSPMSTKSSGTSSTARPSNVVVYSAYGYPIYTVSASSESKMSTSGTPSTFESTQLSSAATAISLTSKFLSGSPVNTTASAVSLVSSSALSGSTFNSTTSSSHNVAADSGMGLQTWATYMWASAMVFLGVLM